MGFHLRKSFNLGPLRLNLSNSGIGFSTGIKGFRVGVDSKGRSYVGGGVGMLRYREYEKKQKTDSDSTDIEYAFKSDAPEELQNGLAMWIKIVIMFLLLPIEFILLFYGFGIMFLDNVGIGGFILGSFFIWPAVAIPYNLFFAKSVRMKQYHQMAIDAYNSGNYKEALEYFKKAQNVKPSKTSYRTICYLSGMMLNCYLNDKKYDESLEFLKIAVINNRREKFVECYYKMENWNDLSRYIQEEYSAEERIEHPAVLAMLSRAFLKLNQKDIALETLLSGPVRKRNMDAEMCAFRYALGECYEANNDITNALKQYKKVYAFDMTYENVGDKIEKLSKK